MGLASSTTRRAVLAGGMLVGALGMRVDGAPRFDLASLPSLRETGKRSGIPYGLVEPTSQFPANRGYFEQLAREANLYAPGNEFSWGNVERSRGVYSYERLDEVVSFMKERDVGVIGHTLLWYYGVPKWAKQIESPVELGDAMEAYISETVGRFAGRVVRWDVINEQVGAKEADGLRRSLYLDRLGFDYMKRAFEVARAADPNALLCYNDFGFEYDRADHKATRRALLNLLRRFRDQNAEIDCIGLQSHLDASMPLDIAGLSTFVREVTRLGYKVAITELDVVDERIDGDETARDMVVAKHVDDYLSCVLAEVKPVTITSWGFTDGHTWLTMWRRRRDGRALRPLPFDDQFNRKEQWAVLSRFVGRAQG